MAIGRLSVYPIGRLNFVARSVPGNLSGTGSVILPRIAKTFSGRRRIRIRVTRETFKMLEV